MRNFWIVLAVFALIAPISARAEIISSIENIKVDATGASAVEAKDKAVAQGEQEAFKQLIEKIAPTQAGTILTSTPPAQVSSMVQGFEVMDEKITDDRYRATLRYNFNPQAIAAITTTMPEAALLAMVPVDSRGTLVLPLWIEEGTLQLWEDNNQWRKAWSKVALEDNSGVIIVPSGDKSDQDMTDAVRASVATFPYLVNFATRYGVSEIVIPQAGIDPANPNGPMSITLKRMKPTGEELQQISIAPNPEEEHDAFLLRAARELAFGVKNIKLPPKADDPNALIAVPARVIKVPLSEWEKIRMKLLSLPNIEAIDLLSISYFKTDFKIAYRGTPDMLGRTLAANGFRLFKDQDMMVIALP